MESRIIPAAQILKYPARPQINQNARNGDMPVTLTSNLIHLSLNPEGHYVSQFSVKVLPEVAKDNFPLFKKILRSISGLLHSTFGKYIISGYSIFTCKQDVQNLINVSTKVDDVDYEIEFVKSNNTIDLSQCTIESPDNLQIKTFIENLIKQILGSHGSLIKFDKGGFYDREHSIQNSRKDGFILPGFNTAVNITEKGLFFRVNTRNKNLSDKTAYQVIVEKSKVYKGSVLTQNLKDFFIGKSLLANYGSYRIYKIDDISEKTVDSTTINIIDLEGKMKTISLCNYYKTQYGIEINDKKQMLLIHRRKGCTTDTYLVPELMFLTGNDDNEESTQFPNNKRFKATHSTPTEKVVNINNVRQLLNCSKAKKSNNPKIVLKSPKEVKDEWGLEFKDFCTLEARVLPPVKLEFLDGVVTCFKNGFSYKKIGNHNGGFPPNSWICITQSRSVDKAKFILNRLKEVSKRYGLPLDVPEIKVCNSSNANAFVNDMMSIPNLGSKKMIFVVLNKFIQNFYTNIKHYIYTNLGIPSQCVLEENRNKPDSYFTNVVNQMVVKTGGELYRIAIHPYLIKDNVFTAIMGLECSSVGKVQKKYSLSISYNKNLSQFYTDQKICERGEEDTVLRLMLTNALNFYLKGSKRLDQLLIYRTGGNDRQNDDIFKKELPTFISFFSGVGPGCFKENCKTSFTFLVVNKKTDLKFFRRNPQDKDGYANPEKGTVIDSHVLNPERFEFYLQPQFVNQGTASPVHFLVLYNQMNIPLEDLESITYKLTYYYWNWNGPIREPAALKFAEVCNSFNSRIIKNDPINEKLKSTPYYI